MISEWGKKKWDRLYISCDPKRNIKYKMRENERHNSIGFVQFNVNNGDRGKFQ